MKSKLTDEDIPDLADIMGEKCFPVYSDSLLLQGSAKCIATLKEKNVSHFFASLMASNTKSTNLT